MKGRHSKRSRHIQLGSEAGKEHLQGLDAKRKSDSQPRVGLEAIVSQGHPNWRCEGLPRKLRKGTRKVLLQQVKIKLLTMEGELRKSSCRPGEDRIPDGMHLDAGLILISLVLLETLSQKINVNTGEAPWPWPP